MIMNKWQQQYLKDERWLDNSYLVTPYYTTAVKRCKCCNKLFFTCEFIDNVKFEDRKLPVCNNCYRKRKDTTARTIIEQYNLKMKCSNCKQRKNICEFGHNKGLNELYKICRDCNKNPQYH